MNTGMQDACNLAWKLALVVHGIGSESLLDSYSEERSPIADQVLKVTGRVTSMATLTGKVMQSLRNHAAALVLGLPLVRKFAADAASEISIGYPHSPLNAPGGHRDPSPGHRAPIRATEPPVGTPAESRERTNRRWSSRVSSSLAQTRGYRLRRRACVRSSSWGLHPKNRACQCPPRNGAGSRRRL
jgi:FAD binding domain